MGRLFLFLAVQFFMLALPVSANPIKDITLEYSHKDKVLKITIDHIVRNKRKEYIRKIVVFHNDVMAAEESYRMQKDPSVFEETVALEAKEGDVLKVVAYEAEGGAKTQSLTVPADSEDGDKAPEEQPAAPAEVKSGGY